MALSRKKPLTSDTPLRRGKGLRSQSKKRQAANRVRRQVVEATFGDRPQCFVPTCVRWADDVHEPLTRGRGGSITDPANMAPLCRPHHDEITFTEPAWAYELGLLRHSWDACTDRLITDLKRQTAAAADAPAVAADETEPLGRTDS